MARSSRPPSLTTLVARLAREHALLPRGELILCACSGGPDSIALLHALALLRRRLGHQLVAVGVDHGLRPEAGAELALGAELARANELPFEAVRVRVTAGGNLQERARQARHAALQRVGKKLGATAIALGHTADDRAETVLMRLMRGAGPRGLAVMPPRSAGLGRGALPLVRPLLLARRRDVELHLERHQLRAARDPSNDDARYLRTRVRQRLLPLLEELSPRIVAHLCDLADALDVGEADPLAGLGRAQRLALARALRFRRPCTVRLSGGDDLGLNFFSNSPVVSAER
jgi:tRNA(Ile)-lysidine synthase